jgi:hypothetical protein
MAFSLAAAQARVNANHEREMARQALTQQLERARQDMERENSKDRSV